MGRAAATTPDPDPEPDTEEPSKEETAPVTKDAEVVSLDTFRRKH
jgi:hypothetical protein